MGIYFLGRISHQSTLIVDCLMKKVAGWVEMCEFFFSENLI